MKGGEQNVGYNGEHEDKQEGRVNNQFWLISVGNIVELWLQKSGSQKSPILESFRVHTNIFQSHRVEYQSLHEDGKN